MNSILQINEAVKIIDYQNLKIITIDFPSNSDLEQIKKIIVEAKNSIARQPKNSVFTLTILGDFHFNNEITKEFHKFIEHNKPYVKAGAVVGISGIKQAMLNSLSLLTKRSFIVVDKVDDGLEYLLKESLKVASTTKTPVE